MTGTSSEPLRGQHRKTGFVLLSALPGLCFALLPLVPSLRALMRVTFADTALLLLMNGAAVVLATLAMRRYGNRSRIYQALAVVEAMVLQGTALWLVFRGGRADSPIFVVYVVFAAINVRFTEHVRVLRVLIALPPLGLALAYLGLRGDPESAAISVVMAGFALLVFEAGIRANLRLREVLREREALEARIAAMRLHEERSRIARELHDGLGAELSALMWRAERIRARLGAGQGGGHQEELGTLIDRAGFSIDELRTVVWALRAPSTTWGALTAYVRDRVNELCAGQIELSFTIDEPEVAGGAADELGIDGELAIDVIRVAQESARNAVRHARASHLHVALALHEAGREVVITVEDDGVGVPQAVLSRDRGGLANLRVRATARGGTASITLRPEGGTTIRVRLPRQTGSQSAPLSVNSPAK